MPITRDEFDAGHTGPAFLILHFLVAYEGPAFASAELGQVGGLTNLDNREMGAALEALVAGGQVERKEINGVLYFTYRKRRLGFPLP